MEKWSYVMFIEKSKNYNRLNKSEITKHVDNLIKLDNSGILELCGVFKGYPGVAGMIILNTQNYEEAEEICKAEPLVSGGYATYKLVALQIATKDNNYLL